MTQNVPFQAVLDALLDDGTPFPAHYLHRFSDLAPADLKLLLKAWPQVSARRKQALLEDLEDLAEADTLTSFDDLARPLLADPEAAVRVQAIHLLWECEDAKLIPTYLEMLTKDENTEVRAAAANALGMFVYLGELEKISPEVHHKIEDHLLEATQTASETLVRRRALESLGYSGRAEVVPLIEAAYRQKDPNWVVSALFAMGRSCDERWNKQVLSQLRAPDDDIRSEAIHAAGELELAAARPTLLDLLEDEEDPELRRELIWALSKIGGEGVRNRLEELFDAETDDEEAEFIEEALDNLAFTEDMTNLDLFSIDSEQSLNEEEADDRSDLQ
jgi:HEAT repeat protein